MTRPPVASPALGTDTRKNQAGKFLDSRIGQLSIQALVVAGFFLLWGLFSQSDIAKKADMPNPVEAIEALINLAATEDYWLAIASTMGSWLLALLLALAVGIPLGLFIGRHGFAFGASKWTIDFLRTVPAVAFVPLFLLVLGQSQVMVVLVAMIPAVWPLLIQSIYAGQQSDPVLHRVSRSYRLTVWDRIAYVLAPEALAFIWPGIRLATTASLLAVIFTELLGGAGGIGVALMDAQIYNRAALLYAWVITACILGLITNGLLALGQKKFLGWHPSQRGKDS